MRAKISVISVTIVLLLISCSKKPETLAVTEVIDSIENIFNQAVPNFPHRTVAFEEDLSIGSEDKDGNIILYQLGIFMVDDAGRIYISDSEEVVLKVFDKNGNPIRSCGKKGDGPGEFQAIHHLEALPDGGCLILDQRSRRTTLFGENGDLLDSHKWQTSLGSLLFAADDYFVAEETIFGENPKILAKQFNFSWEEVRSYGEFKPRERKLIREQGISIVMSRPFSPRSIFAGDRKKQLLYHCLNSEYLIEVYERSGDLLRKIHKVHEPLPLTDEDRTEFYKQFENAPNPTFLEVVKKVELPEFKNAMSRMIVDDQGNLWIETHEKQMENGLEYTAYDIFNADGYYDAKVWLDKQPGEFVNGKMYAIETDEETWERVLKRYRVIWKD